MKKFRVEIDGEEFIVNIEEIKDKDGTKTSVKKNTTEVGGKNRIREEKTAAKKTVSKPKKQTEKRIKNSTDSEGTKIVAPMPGSILEINIEKGEIVNEGDLLIVLEAMKMENEITAAQSGTVKEIKVSVGDSVDAEDVLLVIE